ncbi:MAG: RNA polymerase sigma factor [Anaerolineae bacterium]|nr:RNA polymerase sigma factor [Anaerolineae bacterium]
MDDRQPAGTTKDTVSAAAAPAHDSTTHDERPILALIARCLAGDQAAFTALYEATAPWVYRLAYSILLHPQDAEDVVQETLVYAFRNLGHFDPTRAAFRTWIVTIAVSRCRNARRRKWLPTIRLGAMMNLGLEPAAPEEQGPESAFARRSAREALEKALARLSPRLREAVALRYGQGLTYKEMAAALGCPAKTAESRVRLAHEALRAAFAESHGAEATLVEAWLEA